MDKKKGSGALPGAVVARLTRYLPCAQMLYESGAEWLSSRDIADTLGITAATVRRDLAGLNAGGVTNRGYEAEKMCRGLVEFLGADTGWQVVVVGAGNLGKALALHGNLARTGFNVRGIFDSDGRKVGKTVGKLIVRPMAELPRMIFDERIDIGVIAVPASAAQETADLMIAAGIKGIFNLAFTNIVAPSRVKQVEGRLVTGLLELGHAIKETGGHNSKTTA